MKVTYYLDLMSLLFFKSFFILVNAFFMSICLALSIILSYWKYLTILYSIIFITFSGLKIEEMYTFLITSLWLRNEHDGSCRILVFNHFCRHKRIVIVLLVYEMYSYFVNDNTYLHNYYFIAYESWNLSFIFTLLL